MKTALKGIAGSACEIPFWPKDGVLGNLPIPVPFGGSFSGKPTFEELAMGASQLGP